MRRFFLMLGVMVVALVVVLGAQATAGPLTGTPASSVATTPESGLSATIMLTTTLPSIKDNTLYEDAAGALSNGTGRYLFAGRTASGAIRRTVIAFDVAGQLPPGATVVAASLRLTMSRTISGASSVTLHRLLADWGEGASDALNEEGAGTAAVTGDATWLHRFYNTIPWTTAGGDFAPAVSAEANVSGAGSYLWASPSVITDVQHWLDTPAENWGWLLLGDESTLSTAKRFDSRESINSAVRPALTITYLAPVRLLYLPQVAKP